MGNSKASLAFRRSKIVKLEDADVEIKVYAPTVEQSLKASEMKESEAGVYLASVCAGLSEDEVKALDVGYFMQISDAIKEFIDAKKSEEQAKRR